MDATPLGTLMRRHKSDGAGAFRVLLSDTIAGSMILLSLTGLLLWAQLHKARTHGALLAGICLMWQV